MGQEVPRGTQGDSWVSLKGVKGALLLAAGQGHEPIPGWRLLFSPTDPRTKVQGALMAATTSSSIVPLRSLGPPTL